LTFFSAIQAVHYSGGRSARATAHSQVHLLRQFQMAGQAILKNSLDFRQDNLKSYTSTPKERLLRFGGSFRLHGQRKAACLDDGHLELFVFQRYIEARRHLRSLCYSKHLVCQRTEFRNCFSRDCGGYSIPMTAHTARSGTAHQRRVVPISRAGLFHPRKEQTGAAISCQRRVE
jgi:hypothetical protein